MSNYTGTNQFLKVFISCQQSHGKKKLERALAFWHERRFRWAAPFRKSTCAVPRSSLAEAAHAKMKSGGRRNMSLVDAAYVDLEASACFEAAWRKRRDGGKSNGKGPTGVELMEREEIRQVARATQFANENEAGNSPSDVSLEDLECGIYDERKSHRPDKDAPKTTLLPVASQRKRRSLNSKAFQCALTKCKTQSPYTKVTSILKRQEGI